MVTTKRIKANHHSSTEFVDEHAIDILHKENIKHHITSIDVHEHFPYIKSFNNNDEIRISITNKDAVLLPCESSLLIRGSEDKPGATTRPNTELVNNGFAFLFSEIRYEINNVIVDVVKNPGITTTLKNLPLLSPAERRELGCAGWTEEPALYNGDKCNNKRAFCASDGRIYAIIPLKLWMGFFEDHTRVMTGVKHDLVLIRGRKDKNCLYTKAAAPDQTTITIHDIVWRMPHLTLSDSASLAVTRVLDSRRPIPIQFRRWELQEMPVTTGGKGPFQWSVKTTSKEDHPLYVLFAMQTGRDNDYKMNASEFDSRDITRAKLYLNEEFYPYSELQCKVLWYKNPPWFPYLFEMIKNMERSYYNRNPISAITMDFLSTSPFICWDVSARSSAMLPSQTDVKITWETDTDMLENTVAYCLIIYKTEVQYTPIDDFIVKKNVTL